MSSLTKVELLHTFRAYCCLVKFYCFKSPTLEHSVLSPLRTILNPRFLLFFFLKNEIVISSFLPFFLHISKNILFIFKYNRRIE